MPSFPSRAKWVFPALLLALVASCNQTRNLPSHLAAPVPYSWPRGSGTESVVRVSVAPLRGEPRHSAEQVDQVILGTPLHVLERKGSFAKVRTPYDYEGWIAINLTTDRTDANFAYWSTSSLRKFERAFGVLTSEPDPDSLPVADLVLGARLLTIHDQDGWSVVRLPDGREGFVRSSHLGALPSGNDPNLERLVQRARSLIGVPYLWGGNSSKGFDCSGYTRTLYELEGIRLPRDSSQQVEVGMPIKPADDYSNLRPGDLLFFGARSGRITHVALSLGGPRFIHCAGDVHIRSLDETAADFDRARKYTLQQVRRVVINPR